MTFMDRPSSENSDNMNNMNGGVEPNEVMADDEDYDFVQYIEDEELIEVLDGNENDMDDQDSDADNEMDMLTDNHPILDDADLVFSNHTGAIFCCHLDPKTNSLAVTGSEDEKAYVWNTSSGDILFECTNHKDSVTAAEFSHDGTYLATGDMSGVIQVWKVATKTCVWNNAIGDLSWMKWHPGSAVLFAAAASGEVYMWKIPSGECKIFPSHGVSSECAQMMPDGRRAAFGYSDGSVRVYDLKSCDSLATFKPGEAHSGTVYCMDVHPDNNMIVSGGGDGLIVLYKSQPGKVLSIFKDAIEDGGSEDEAVPWVEAVKFSPDPNLPLVAAGTLTGELYIWDIAKQAIRNKIDVDCGINRIVWDKQSPAIYASLLDGSVKIFDSRNGNLKSQLYGHKNHILDASLSQDGSLLLTASEDKTARVFSLSTPDR